jgi:hypothetical protein
MNRSSLRPDKVAALMRSRSTPEEHEQDPRAAGLAAYLRRCAESFSLSADVTDSPATAEAGAALLDAALLVEVMKPDDPLLVVLSEAGLFESMPGGRARFLESDAVRRAIQRPIAGAAQDSRAILASLADAVAR